jgi:type VII secretion protein EccB
MDCHGSVDLRFNLTRYRDSTNFPGGILNRRPPRQPTTWLHVSGYRFLIRRIECALLRRDIGAVNEPLRAHTASLALGCVLASVVVAGCGLVALLRPQVALDRAQIVMGRESGALYVRVGDTWHPVLNLASARLIAATDTNPQPVPESELGRTKRGPLLGIPGAPQLLGRPLAGDEAPWTICDPDGKAATTIVIGRTEGSSSVRRLAPERAILVAPGSGSPAYLLYNGRRAVVDLADAAVVRALRLQDRVPHIVSQA